ncbi:TRAP transporter small permease subunit [Rhizobium halophytocola]|uniref:TRAP transporter small permease protein n=1 Tax=Rhizobium halophytocola TaxID=735519 RepID=A0ABS4DUN1_9HYPH|nr:TRAP transporter small permease subunit [Rhizobium halophytocola]MBP1849392.1 TRAP-type mannitol/chloroaromatic compound transport system permease small subunit [Rhizobium halophytocola]
MLNRLETVADHLDKCVEVVGRIAAWSGLLLVLVMANNVLLRYLFNTGSVALQELEWHLMSPLALLCIAYTVQQEGHVRVDVLYARFPASLRQAIDLFSTACVLIFALVVVLLSWPYVMQSYRIGEGSPDPGGLPFRFVLKAMIPAGFGLLALQSMASLLRSVASCFGRTPGAAPVSR